MKTTIKITQDEDNTIITNDRGHQWKVSSMVFTSYALSAVIYGTIVPWYYKTFYKYDEFEITLTIKTK